MAQMVSFVARLRALAEAAPDAVAITSGEEILTRAELEAASERFARRLLADGVKAGDMVSIVLPNSAGWFVALVASWKVGATPQPISSRAPERERDAIIALAKPSAVVDRDPLADDGSATSEEPLPDVVSASWKAPTSGGSTGRPKLIVSGDPAEMDADAPIGSAIGIAANGCLVMPGPMYHNGPLIWSSAALLSGSHVVLLPRFDPVESRHITFLGRVSHDAMPRIYADHDVLVFASSRNEGMPMVMMEAMCAGCAVPNTGSGGSIELAERAGTPIFPKEHPFALSRLLSALERDRARVADIALRGQQTVLRDFTIDRMLQQAEDLIIRVAGRQPVTELEAAVP